MLRHFAWVLLVLVFIIITLTGMIKALEDDDWDDDDNVDDDGSFPDIKVTDCTVFCDIPTNTQIKKKNLIAKMELPKTFEFYFEYNLQEFTEWFDEGNFLELECGGKSKWKMNIQPQFLMKPYYNGKELESKLQILYSQQPSVPLPSQAKKVYRIFHRQSIQFLEEKLVLEGIARNQKFEFDVGPMTTFGKCKLWAANDDNDFAINAMIRNVRFRALSFHPTPTPTYRPTGTAKPTPVPTTAMPTNAPLCCDSYSYTDEWQQCTNSKDDHTQIDSCEHCNSYQCTDWTIGSTRMQEREFSYMEDTGDDVYFAVGAYGTDPAKAGLCYRLNVQDVPKSIIMQVITTEPANLIDKKTVRIQMANGGLGFDGNACSSYGTRRPQYAVEDDPWGDISIGWNEKKDCQYLPEYPMCGKLREDNLQELCEWGFDNNFRKSVEPGLPFIGPPISSICEVNCPWQLWQATGYHRSDEKVVFNSTLQSVCRETDTNTNYVYVAPEEAVTYNDTQHLRLQGTMDCGSPEYQHVEVGLAFASFYHGHDRVVGCKRDGYARINAQPTMRPTSIPSEMPTSRPTAIPTSHPTWAPSVSFKPTPNPTRMRPSSMPTEPGATHRPTQTPKVGGTPAAPVQALSDVQVGDNSLPFVALLAIFVAGLIFFAWAIWAGYFECKHLGERKKERLERKRKWNKNQKAYEMQRFKDWEAYDEDCSDYYSSDENGSLPGTEDSSTSSNSVDDDNIGEFRKGLANSLGSSRGRNPENKENTKSSFLNWNSNSSKSDSRSEAQASSQSSRSIDSASVEDVAVSPLARGRIHV